MSTTTKNYGFIKLERTDPADITAINENWDKIDEGLNHTHETIDNDLSLEGHRISNVAEPTYRSDVATKGFVEDFSIEGSTYVAVDENKDGNIVLRPYIADEDNLVFASHLTDQSNPHKVTAAQVKALPLTGGTLTGALTTKGIKLTSGTDYGTTLPSSGTTGQLFFKVVG